MRRLPFALLLLPLLCWAGAYDYYECVGPGGDVSHSVERCPKGHKQRRIEDDAAPETRSLGAVAGGVIRLQSGPGGHFYTTASINGTPMRVVVDTGATDVAISPSAAQRARIDTRRGIRGMSYTANGTTPVTAVLLDSVEFGGNTVRQVRAVVLSQELGPHEEVLLGMSFLRHFEVSTDGALMTLRPK
ncbi:MAG: TIGR02281 family clan AA aspartic protease [Ignavibacteria bacterium]